jgi:hypothetical protein
LGIGLIRCDRSLPIPIRMPHAARVGRRKQHFNAELVIVCRPFLPARQQEGTDNQQQQREFVRIPWCHGLPVSHRAVRHHLESWTNSPPSNAGGLASRQYYSRFSKPPREKLPAFDQPARRNCIIKPPNSMGSMTLWDEAASTRRSLCRNSPYAASWALSMPRARPWGSPSDSRCRFGRKWHPTTRRRRLPILPKPTSDLLCASPGLTCQLGRAINDLIVCLMEAP